MAAVTSNISIAGITSAGDKVGTQGNAAGIPVRGGPPPPPPIFRMGRVTSKRGQSTGLSDGSDSTSATDLSLEIKKANNTIATENAYIAKQAPRLERKKKAKAAKHELDVNAEKRRAAEQELKVDEATDAGRKEDKKLAKKLEKAKAERERKAAKTAAKAAAPTSGNTSSA